jgi:hypothetical protein
MTKAAPHPRSLHFATLFTAPGRRRLLLFFMLENLLKARAQSSFPTGSRGQDEDVNIYLANLLTEHVVLPVPGGVAVGGEPLLGLKGEEHWKRWRRFEHYRRNGDHRLLALGLYGRGDLLRRRAVPLGLDAGQSWARDLQIGRDCYQCALSMLRSPQENQAGLALVLTKLAQAFADYVHVLQTLARRRFGLGARLSQAELHALASSPSRASDASATDSLSGMDDLLDLLLEYRRHPTPRNTTRLTSAAKQQGIDLSQLLQEPPDSRAQRPPRG